MVYGDIVDPGCRALIIILKMLHIQSSFTNAPKLLEKDKEDRQVFSRQKPEEFMPLVLMHGSIKIVGSFHQILMYLVKIFPKVRSFVFDNELRQKDKQDSKDYRTEMKKYLSWIKVSVSPHLFKLLGKLQGDDPASNIENIKELVEFLEDNVLKKLDTYIN